MSDYVSYVYSITSERNLSCDMWKTLTRISKVGTKYNDKHRLMFFINIQTLAIGLRRTRALLRLVWPSTRLLFIERWRHLADSNEPNFINKKVFYIY